MKPSRKANEFEPGTLFKGASWTWGLRTVGSSSRNVGHVIERDDVFVVVRRCDRDGTYQAFGRSGFFQIDHSGIEEI